MPPGVRGSAAALPGGIRFWLERADAEPPSSEYDRVVVSHDTVSGTPVGRRATPLALDHAPAVLRANYAVADQIYKIGSTRGYGPWIDYLGPPDGQTTGAAAGLIGAASHQYAQRAKTAKTLSILGSGLAILLLRIAFTLVYRRAGRAKAIAERLAAENAKLAALNRDEAVTDALTGLRNRRALSDARSRLDDARGPVCDRRCSDTGASARTRCPVSLTTNDSEESRCRFRFFVVPAVAQIR